MKLKNQKAAYN